MKAPNINASQSIDHYVGEINRYKLLTRDQEVGGIAWLEGPDPTSLSVRAAARPDGDPVVPHTPCLMRVPVRLFSSGDLPPIDGHRIVRDRHR